MKAKWLVVLAVACLGMMTACSKEEKDPVEFYFYTPEASETEQWTLFIDDEEVGVLPYAAVAPDCNNSETLGGLLLVSVDQGRHCYRAKDASGNLRAHGYIKVVDNEKGQELRSGSGADGMGGATLEWKCEFVTMGVFD